MSRAKKRSALALSDRAGTIAKRATALAGMLSEAGYRDLSRDMATIAHKAAEIDGTLYHEAKK